ncbi:TPA: hypothetical protein NIA41_000397 [Pseudomonas aeruginosa]|nr:hypothetical protein [Pseudomonas aeruginosa]
MKNRAISYSLLLLLGAMSASCGKVVQQPAIKVSAEVDGTEIDVLVTNKSLHSIQLVNPTFAVTPGNTNGIEVRIVDDHGVQVPICAMVEPIRNIQGDDLVTLRAGESIRQTFDVATLGRRFCLKNDRYEATFVLNQPPLTYTSNRVDLVLKEHGPPG